MALIDMNNEAFDTLHTPPQLLAAARSPDKEKVELTTETERVFSAPLTTRFLPSRTSMPLNLYACMIRVLSI
jgi:hypothetical protein